MLEEDPMAKPHFATTVLTYGKSRMHFQRIAASAVAVLLALAACQDAPIMGPSADGVPDPLLGARSSNARAVSVYNQNLYAGTDLDAVLAALTNGDPADDLPAVQQAAATLLATDFPSRANAIADEIAKAHPHVIGLQEVWTLEVDVPGVPVVNQNFLEILMAALADRDLDYVVAATVTGAQAQLPGVNAVDHDVLLADPTRVAISTPTSQVYAFNVGEVFPGVTLVRGYVAIEGVVEGEPYLFVSTHLESDLPGLPLPGLRAAQATELVTAIGAADRVVLMGDLNDVSGSPMHQVIAGAGFTDVWDSMRPGNNEGLTCCHSPDLSNRFAGFDKRIDYVFSRGVGNPAGVGGWIKRLGTLPSDKLTGPQYRLWPSDHAGVAAELRG
jgi:endonuclease/exonuclease/phosphatase family metal-dependent hydrolase